MSLIGARVLIVEDEIILAMMIEDLLKDLGCRVAGIASSLKEAEDEAHVAAIDLATLDVNLGGEFSYPVAHILRDRHIPFLFITGYGLAGISPELMDSMVLLKPFTQAQLGTALRTVWQS